MIILFIFKKIRSAFLEWLFSNIMYTRGAAHLKDVGFQTRQVFSALLCFIVKPHLLDSSCSHQGWCFTLNHAKIILVQTVRCSAKLWVIISMEIIHISKIINKTKNVSSQRSPCIYHHEPYSFFMVFLFPFKSLWRETI